MSGVKIGKAKTVNIGGDRGGFSMPVSVGGGGVAILVIVVLAATHQHTTLAVFQGIVWALAIIGAALVAYGVWWARNRAMRPQQAPVCACQQHQVPQHAVHPAELPAAGARPALPAPQVTNYFYGDQAAQAAMEAMRRDRPEG